MSPLRFGYGTNGLADHRLTDAVAMLADLGYDGVALTLDHAHLDPFAPDLAGRTAALAARLDALGLAVVVETGARYLLDPRRKHEPTLVSSGDRSRRLEYLRRAVAVGADLGAEAVSFWSGTLPAGTPPEVGWERLRAGAAEVVGEAERRGVVVAVEPEPGMLVEDLGGVLALRRDLGGPDALRVTIDVGHLRCNEDEPPPDCVRRVGALLANVQIDDMRRGVHEHLALGTGEVDFPPVLSALLDVGYRGLVSVELPRDSHAGPVLAERSIAFLRSALAEAVAPVPTGVRA